MKSCLSTLLLMFLLFPPIISAQELSNSEIKLELDSSPKAEKGKEIQIETYKNISEDIKYNAEVTEGDRYIITIPYFEDYNGLPLGITLSQEFLSFGTVTSGEPILRNQELSVFSQSNRGYTVFTAQDHGLSSSSNIQIPNTSCDSGSCTAVLSDKWELPLTYGFGYTCENRETCNSSFEGGLYRRFGSLDAKEGYAVILSGLGNSTTNIIFKLNISPTQTKDIYKNTIYYILTSQF